MFDQIIISKKLIPLLKPKLHRLIKLAAPHAMVSRNRLQNLHRLYSRIERNNIPGNVVEAGVARGGSAILLAKLALDSPHNRHVWLFDAFELIDPVVANFDQVKHTLYNEIKLPADRVHLIKGFFNPALDQYPTQPIAFLHIDASHYQPTTDCLDRLLHHVSPGGAVVVDNYGASDGCRKAIDERLNTMNPKPQLHRFSHTQAYFQIP